MTGTGVILAGDVGGTNSRMAAFAWGPEGLEPRWQKTWPSRGGLTLTQIVSAAREESGASFLAASFGVAGPVREGRVETTNLPWKVDGRDLARALDLERVGLLNDLEANAWGLETLGERQLHVLQAGRPDPSGARVLVSAGTGLGEGGLFWDGERHRAFASEGGHSSFAPTDEREVELWTWLRARFGHVSAERVLSGPGLHNLYQFLRERDRRPETTGLAERIRSGDPAAEISKAAASGECDVCREALEWFVRLYGAEAANLALKVLATGGVYLGGGMSPRLLPWLEGPGFLGGFHAKGRLRPVLEAMPVHVILESDTALRGAGRHAWLQVERGELSLER